MRTLCAAVIFIVGMSSAVGHTKANTAALPQTRQTGTSGAQAAARVTLQQYEGIEKTINEQYSALQKQLAARRLKEVSQAAQELAVAFGESEKFWAERKKPDAIKWTESGRTLATEVVGASTAGDAAKTEQTAAKIMGICNECHTAYREMDGADGFRLKASALSTK
jgi:hypothetical protein